MAEEYPRIDRFVEAYGFVADWPRERVVGERCRPPNRQPCSYGEFCICAAYEAVWLKLNEGEDRELTGEVAVEIPHTNQDGN